MKTPLRIALLLFIILPALHSCKKTNRAPDAVDAIISTYTGSMHLVSSYAAYSQPPTVHDTTYPMTITIQKIANDTFMVGDSLFENWLVVSGSYTSTTHIHYDPSNNYTSSLPTGAIETMHFSFGNDSLYYTYQYSHPGGATTNYETRRFSGKK